MNAWTNTQPAALIDQSQAGVAAALTLNASSIHHSGGTIAVTVPIPIIPSPTVPVQSQQQQQLTVQSQQHALQQQPVILGARSEPEFVHGHSITEVYTNNNYVSCSSGVGIQFGSSSSPGSVGALSNPSSGEQLAVHPQQISSISPQQQEVTTVSTLGGSDNVGMKTVGSSTGGGVVITKIVEHPYSAYASSSALYNTDTEDEWSRRASAVDPREIQMVAEKMMRTMPSIFTEVTKKLAASEAQTNLTSSINNGSNINSSCNPIFTGRNHHIDLDGSLPNLNNLESVVAATAALAGSAAINNSSNDNYNSNMICSQPNIPCNHNNSLMVTNNPSTNHLINATSAAMTNIASISGDTTTNGCDGNFDRNSAIITSVAHHHQQIITSNSDSKLISASSPSITLASACSSSSTSAACCNPNKANKLQVGGRFFYFLPFIYL